MKEKNPHKKCWICNKGLVAGGMYHGVIHHMPSGELCYCHQSCIRQHRLRNESSWGYSGISKADRELAKRISRTPAKDFNNASDAWKSEMIRLYAKDRT